MNTDAGRLAPGGVCATIASKLAPTGVVNDDAGCLTPSGVWACIASKLAPTGGGVNADADSLSPHPSHSDTRPEGMGCEANAERVLASLKHQGL
ncbi:hypothetical protein [Pseudomonas sp. S2_E01]